MRIRQVKPDYWKDSRLHNTPGITADVREFYVGLWGVADDLGWMRWDVPEVASDLYRYRSPARREKQARDWMARLAKIGRVEVYECGHAFIPKFTAHQRVGGTKAQTYLLEHQRCSAQFREPPQSSALERNGKGNGKERNGTERGDFDNALARATRKARIVPEGEGMTT